MEILTKILKIVFFISLPTAVFLSFYRPKLPDIPEIRNEIKTIPPVQKKFESKDVSKIIEGFEYRISPKYRYEIYGLVVSDYDSDNWLDVRHENDPGNIKDICIVWGENILNGSYKSVSYKSGEFTCYYGWESDINTHFSGNLLSNNHLIPSNEYVAGRIKNATIGDQIRIVGYLSDYSVFDQAGNKVFERPTSVSRNDAGNGACETIYVNDFKILKGNNIIYKQIRNYGAIVALGSLILLIVLFFITPSKKRETYKAKADILK